jgi:hypothetical protein
MEENNKVEQSEIQIIGEDESVNSVVENAPTEVDNSLNNLNNYENDEQNSHSEYLNDLMGPNSKISVYALLVVGIAALIVIIFCLFLAF